MSTSVEALIKLTLLSAFVSSVCCVNQAVLEYYWRPWTPGSPPSDAITLRDYRGVSYIVEAYVPNHGLHVGQVFANQQEVNVTVANTSVVTNTVFLVRSSTDLKVLCSQSLDKVSWYPTSNANVQNELVTAVINPVLGGVNNFNQAVYIGRVAATTTQRPWLIGSVVKDNRLRYHFGGITTSAAVYEILVVNSNKCLGG
ncbi:hypothetical protein NQ315_001169 [Exocentrus adspersus]|uniref:Uncharacterized protein n=1 Tax=Exocentrus adspersus TaxID=1586481 RepID=A0AAV8WEQ4_9CUCU|nr:hypothetical protein NQ315_001169 [Exocentrus adspersus]